VNLVEDLKVLEAPAHKFIVIYIRISEDKDRGLLIHGPWFGDTTATKQDAEEEAKRLVKEARNVTTVPRIYQIEPHKPNSSMKAMDLAREYFAEMEVQMREAKRLTDRRKK